MSTNVASCLIVFYYAQVLEMKLLVLVGQECCYCLVESEECGNCTVNVLVLVNAVHRPVGSNSGVF